jgi:hypothetical protein
MTITDTGKPVATIFKPIVEGLDTFDQAAELARLRRDLQKVSTGHPSYLIRRGVVRCLKLDLLRFGNLRVSKPGIRGFGVVRDSEVFRDYVYSRIVPVHLMNGYFLSCVAFGILAFDVIIDAGVPEIVYSVPTATDLEMEQVWEDCGRYLE